MVSINNIKSAIAFSFFLSCLSWASDFEHNKPCYNDNFCEQFSCDEDSSDEDSDIFFDCQEFSKEECKEFDEANATANGFSKCKYTKDDLRKTCSYRLLKCGKIAWDIYDLYSVFTLYGLQSAGYSFAKLVAISYLMSPKLSWFMNLLPFFTQRIASLIDVNNLELLGAIFYFEELLGAKLIYGTASYAVEAAYGAVSSSVMGESNDVVPPRQNRTICGVENTMQEEEYSINFLFINNKPRTIEDGPYFFGRGPDEDCQNPSKQEEDFANRLVTKLHGWLSLHPKNARITLWVDYNMVDPKVIESSQQFICEELTAGGVDTSNLFMRDFREIPTVRQNQDIFDEKTPIWHKVDLGRILATIQALKESAGRAGYAYYSDLDATPVAYDKIATKENLEILNDSGFACLHAYIGGPRRDVPGFFGVTESAVASLKRVLIDFSIDAIRNKKISPKAALFIYHNIFLWNAERQDQELYAFLLAHWDRVFENYGNEYDWLNNVLYRLYVHNDREIEMFSDGFRLTNAHEHIPTLTINALQITKARRPFTCDNKSN